MSKSILEFNLPEEKIEQMMAIKGAEAHFALAALAQEMRADYKYGEDSFTSSYWSERLFEIARDYGVEVHNEY